MNYVGEVCQDGLAPVPIEDTDTQHVVTQRKNTQANNQGKILDFHTKPNNNI